MLAANDETWRTDSMLPWCNAARRMNVEHRHGTSTTQTCLALQDALDVSMKMALSIPLEDIIAYQKVAKAYFGLMEVLCHSHVHVIAACDTPTFAFLLSSLDSGLKSLDNSVCSLCAQAIDNLAGQYFRGLQAAADDKPNTTAQVQYNKRSVSLAVSLSLL